MLFVKLIEIIVLIKQKGIRLDTVLWARSIIKIYVFLNLIVKNLIMR